MRISDWSSDVCSSDLQLADAAAGGGHELELQRLALGVVPDAALQLGPVGGVEQRGGLGGVVGVRLHILVVNPVERRGAGLGDGLAALRSEERRVGKEGVRTCRFWWSTYHYTNKKKKTK